jgi:HSP20 family molecular chaperone IbpA
VPRQWLYATRPKFRRLNGSLVDCLRNVEEVRLLVDLGKFFPGEVCLDIKPDRYFVTATRDNLHFAEEIPLPNDTDISMKEEHFKDGILEFVLPKKTEVGGPAKTGKGDDG